MKPKFAIHIVQNHCRSKYLGTGQWAIISEQLISFKRDVTRSYYIAANQLFVDSDLRNE
jgi:retron-type reverse transcriptase